MINYDGNNEITARQNFSNHLTNIKGLMVWTEFLFKSQFYGPSVPIKPIMTML